MNRRAASDWANLQDDILGLITKKLDARDCRNSRLSCRCWCEVISSHLEVLRPRLLPGQALSAFPATQNLDLTACNLHPGDLERLWGIGQIRSLALTTGQASSSSQALKDCVLLTELCIHGDADDSVVAAIASLCGMRRLEITDWTSFHPSSAAAMLGSLSNLTSLRLDRVSIDRFSPQEDVVLPCQSFVSALPGLQSLDLGLLADSTPPSLEALGALARLTSLGLGTPPNEQGFKALGGLTSLVRLRIMAGRRRHGPRRCATAGCVASLATLVRLQEVAVVGCDWRDEKGCLSALSSLTALTVLDMSHAVKGSKVDGQVLGSFPLERLQQLRLRNSWCTPGSLATLSRAPHLTALDISGCSRASCSSYLHALPAMSQLRDLKMDDFGGAEGCRIFSSLQSLTSLEWGSSGSGGHWFACAEELDDEPRVAALLQHSSCLTSLLRLCIPQQCLGPDAGDTLSRLAYLTGLTHLDLRGTFCPAGQSYDSLANRLSTLTALQTLDLSGTALGSQTLRMIGKLKALNSLDLAGLEVGDDDILPLQNLPHLRSLRLDSQLHARLTDRGLATLAGVTALTRLTLRNNCYVSGEGLGVLSRLDSLAFLDVRGAEGMHPQAALQSLQGCPCLEEVLLGDSHDPCVMLRPGVPASQLEALRSSLPYLRSIAVGGEVLTGRRECAWASLQFKIYSAAVELSRIYTCLRESIRESRKGRPGSVALAFLDRLLKSQPTPAVACGHPGSFKIPSLLLNNWE